MGYHKYNKQGLLIDAKEPGYWSVTTILDIIHKKWLWEWKLNLGRELSEKKSNDAAERGTIVHNILERIDLPISKILKPNRGDIYINFVDEEFIIHALQGYFRWVKDYQPKTIASELFVLNEKDGYAGTIDRVCEINGELWIVDFKTSKAIYRDYGLQLKAYEKAFGKKCRMAVLQLGLPTKKGYKFKELKEPYYAFLAVKTVFDWNMK